MTSLTQLDLVFFFLLLGCLLSYPNIECLVLPFSGYLDDWTTSVIATYPPELSTDRKKTEEMYIYVLVTESTPFLYTDFFFIQGYLKKEKKKKTPSSGNSKHNFFSLY